MSGTLEVNTINPKTGTIVTINSCTFTAGAISCIGVGTISNFTNIALTGTAQINTIDPKSGTTVTVNGCVVSTSGISCTGGGGTSSFTNVDVSNALSTNLIATHSGTTTTLNATTVIITGTLDANTISPQSGSTVTLSATTTDHTGTVKFDTLSPHTTSGSITVNPPLLLQNSVASYTPTGFSYYEEATATTTATGPFTTSQTWVFTIRRIGKVTTLSWGVNEAACTVATTINAVSGSIPARFVPSQAAIIFLMYVVDNGSTFATPGYMQFVADGSYQVVKSISTPNFSATGANCGILYGAITWTN